MTPHQRHNFKARQQQLLDILPQLRRFAISLAGNLADGDDLLQNTVERLLTRGLPDEAELRPWSFKVCRNLWIDEVRSRKVRQQATRDPTLQESVSVSSEHQAIAEITWQEAHASIARLPEEQRAVLELVVVEGYRYQQAAEILGCPVGTVMSRLARARAALAGLAPEGNRSGKMTEPKGGQEKQA